MRHALDRLPVAVGDRQVEGGVGQRPAAGRRGIGRERRRRGEPVDERHEAGADPVGDARPDLVAGRRDGVGIDVAADLAGDVGLARKLQHLGAEGRLELLVFGDIGERIDERDIEGDDLARCRVGGAQRQRAHGQRLRRLPAVERVGVGAQQEQQVGFREVDVEPHRRREAAQERGHRPAGDAVKDDRLAGLGELDHVAVDAPAAGLVEGEVVAIGADQAEAQRDVLRLLARLARRRRAGLFERQRIGLLARIVAALGDHLRRAGLAVPQLELAEVGAGGVGEGGEEVLDGDRLAVVALK